MNTPKRTLSPLSWVLLIGFGLFAILLLWVPDTPKTPEENLPWHAQILDQGQKLKVLGLTLPDSTLADAMKLYGKDVEIRLFSNKDESNKSLEAYFPVMYVSSIKASLLLKLQASPEELNHFYDRGIETTVTTTGQRQVKLSGKDIPAILQKPIEALTLIPKSNLTYRAIKMRFGEPQNIQTDPETHIERWHYPKYGLELIYDPEGPEALQYSLAFTH